MANPIPAFSLVVLLVSGTPRDELRKEVLLAHADMAHGMYSKALESALVMRDAIQAFVLQPDEPHLAKARTAWVQARLPYGQSEALRFMGGPVDSGRGAPETLMNAWPIDEAFLDYVDGRPAAGLIQDTKSFTVLDSELLARLSATGGETDIATGWHAIEFLLWGQDLSPKGPGSRSAMDYVPGQTPHAARRAQVLEITSDLLCRHLSQLVRAWAPEGRHRVRFLARPDQEQVRAILSGLATFTAIELAGERLAVAYETQDQEQEHSCFSDNTRADLIANLTGIVRVWRGGKGPGLDVLAQRLDPELHASLSSKVEISESRLRAIPQPFDQAILGDDDSPGRRAVLGAIEALEALAEGLEALEREL